MSKEITIKSYELGKPDQMAKMADVLKGHIMKHNLFTPISGKNYVHADGWSFAGGLMGLLPKVVCVENLSSGNEIKWKVEVEIISSKDNSVVSRGFALCSNKENKKKSFDEYAILSMAQTRSISKAYKNIIGWVLKLSGYESTPSEEMSKMGDNPPPSTQTTPISQNLAKSEPKKGQVAGPDGKFTYVCDKCGDPITNQGHELSQKIYKKSLCREHFNEIKNKKR